jgi:protein-tyrosine phosphatase
MRGFVDLHSHYLPCVDDGVRSEDDGVALLRALRSVGFDHVVATPHMRPGMFDNHAAPLREAYAAMRARLDRETDVPTTELASEHFFDDIVYERLMRGDGLAYGVGRAVLVEFNPESMPVQLSHRLFDLRRKRLRPIIAHPERYQAFWRSPSKEAENLRRAGGVLLLDVAALDGKYGSKSQRTAEQLVDEGAYYAACSDAHRAEDAVAVGRGIELLEQSIGAEEAMVLLRDHPRRILSGNILDVYD